MINYVGASYRIRRGKKYNKNSREFKREPSYRKLNLKKPTFRCCRTPRLEFHIYYFFFIYLYIT